MALVMAVAIFSSPVLGILSRFLIDDAGLSRTQLGWLAAAMSLTAALSGPTAGHVADRLGGRTMVLATFGVAGIGLLALAGAPTYVALLGAGLVAGIAQAGANPATNKLIGLYIPQGRRGIVTGVKQSGVQMGVFFGGLVLPGFAVAHGWRTALALTALVPVVGLLLVPVILPKRATDHVVKSATRRAKGPIPHEVRWLAIQGIAVGYVGGAAITFLPLFAEEEVGVSVTTAGTVVAVFGLAGLLGRLGFSFFAERSSHLGFPMLVVTSLSFVGVLMLWTSPTTGRAFLWIGSALIGIITAWTPLAMLAVITSIDQSKAGRATGYVSGGFGLGLGAGPAVFSSLVDATDSFNAGWLFVLITVGVAVVLVIGWIRTSPDAKG